jgi:hypothetical protein
VNYAAGKYLSKNNEYLTKNESLAFQVDTVDEMVEIIRILLIPNISGTHHEDSEELRSS